MEKGRSMVEMLGVLAVIGVLSVGGIVGYSTAMNKHKANNVLQEASLRAASIAQQLENDPSAELTLAEFPSEVGDILITDWVSGPDGFSELTEDDRRFSIAFYNLNDDVIKQIEMMAGGSNILRKIVKGDDYVSLVYNKDLSTTEDECKNSCNYSSQECVNNTCKTKHCPAGKQVAYDAINHPHYCEVDDSPDGTHITCGNTFVSCYCHNKQWSCDMLPM